MKASEVQWAGITMNIHTPLTQLTVEELQTLIRQTVQEAVVEVLVEFTVAAENDAHLQYQAEMTELLRHRLGDHGTRFLIPDD